MNKKIISLSLAGVMLLSTASPVFATTEAKAEVKEPTKAEKIVKDAKEATTEAKAEVKEEKVALTLEETKEAIKKEIAQEKTVRESEAYKNAKDDVITNYENAIAAGKSLLDDDKATKEQFENELFNLKDAVKQLGLKADKKVEETKTVDVKATTQKVKLDGKDVVIYGYNIEGYNYFKLRDLASVLKDTKAKFGVEYKDDVVTLTKGGDYKVTESDQKEVKAESKGMLTNDKVLVGDKALTATAYKIDDSNYYKLRDLGEALGFGVDFDKTNNTVLLVSEKEEKAALTLEETKEAIKKEIAQEKTVRESEAYKNAKEDVITNYENAIAAGKSLLDDDKATKEQFENELSNLKDAVAKLGFKADKKVEEKAEESKKDTKETKEEVKETKEEVKETK
ncbi:FIVAR domain-containing protein [Peptoniphilus porci]|uniref:Copper amine oxidase N-terminal domain n=1 Tax=Peptoniphilus porci TaxID=2652280 RepID=A0A1U7LZA1_9FIRM|nr:FIVAR domain-containing protein [Peptoniphilus porci]OLR64739.1 hypothetical protein BIV18_03990 [Peptoniphilus porci]